MEGPQLPGLPPAPALTRTGARGAEAKSDLVNVLSHLEAHWHVLEAEVVEINRDIEYCEQCLRKYGEWFNSPLQYLRVRGRSAAQRAVSATRMLTLPARRAQELKRTKKNKMCAPGPGRPQLACRGRAALGAPR